MPANVATHSPPISCDPCTPVAPSNHPDIYFVQPALPPRPSGWYTWGKVIFETTFAFSLLLVLTPVILLLALVIRLTSRGPSFYSQVRLGRDGRPFRIYKLRTMIHNCEHQSGAKWSRPGDPRVTFLGRFLRPMHLDEFPQLWNVVKGEMSLVGPRPERPEFLPSLERQVPGFRSRLLVKPGVTGLAQVQLPPDSDVHSVRRKLAYDLHYIGQMNFWLDLRLIFCTGLHMIGVPYGVLARLCGLPSPERDPRPKWVTEPFAVTSPEVVS
jgi:lipopolysaccharide/colanic/teichoic acid biosynthesis glycosyltransferase